tara:strand:- start:3724 stop:3873 length:150 start_codon:yes stop_codon:yes gene_type:complete
MVTQRETLKEKISTLEAELFIASKNQDAFIQVDLYNQIEILKSTLINLD